MKWIAVKSQGISTRIVRVEDIAYFYCTPGGEGLMAEMKYDGEQIQVADAPFIRGSPAAFLLAQLNGPVGEVPYK